MTMRQFIREHRAELTAAILAQLNRPNDKGEHSTPITQLNDEDRRQWILNDEGLYRWARAEGVRI